MSDDDAATQHYSTEQAFNAGVNRGKELQQQADAEESQQQEADTSADLTMEKVQAMSQEEHIARKPEIDAWLTGGQR